VSSRFLRTYLLDDISVRSGGDGRTVDAYAAVFNSPTVISDREGTYLETIAPTAFDRTIALQGTRFGVFFNHGLTLHGTPSERGSMPIGTPIEVRADQRGVFTSTRYNKNALAEEALEAIRSGAITGQSFAGRFVSSNPKAPPGGWRMSDDGDLTTVTRDEIAMTEYGPTPIPAYQDAAIVGVRNLGCTCERGTTIELEVNIDGGGEPADPPAAAGCDCTCDCCTAGDCPNCSPASPGRNAPSDVDPRAAHSNGRLLIRRNSIRRQLRERGIQ